jgi:hypothetical protein
MRYDLKATAFALTIFSLLVLSTAQDSNTCSGSDRYCFQDSVYQCHTGTPIKIESCQDGCEEGDCIQAAVAPNVYYKEPEVEETGPTSGDMILYISLGIVLFTIAILFVRIKRKK